MIRLGMKRIVAVAKGDVQRVGYRDEVEKIARKLGLTGYVENLKPYDVGIVAEGDEEKLKLFIEHIKIRKYPIFVESVEVIWQEATGEFSFFEIRRGEWTEELFERLDTAGRLLYRSVELSEKAVKLGERSVELSEAILRATREESEKTREEIRLLRSDLREYMEENLKEIRSRIMEIEAALKKAGIM